MEVLIFLLFFSFKGRERKKIKIKMSFLSLLVGSPKCLQQGCAGPRPGARNWEFEKSQLRNLNWEIENLTHWWQGPKFHHPSLPFMLQFRKNLDSKWSPYLNLHTQIMRCEHLNCILIATPNTESVSFPNLGNFHSHYIKSHVISCIL